LVYFKTSGSLEKIEKWSLEILPKSSIFDLRLGEFWNYKDLILLFVKRELVPTYKQTILGPLWFILQPLLTTLVYSIIFGVVARIPTGGIPQILFYMSGIVLWNFFNTSFTKASGTFVANSHIFGKVYFPRLILPVSGLISSFVNFLIQLSLFLIILICYYLNGANVHPGFLIFLSPVFLLMLSLYALGMGMIIASFSTKYKDLSHFLAFGSQLLMYSTPIIYPASIVPEKFKWISYVNPLSPIFEGFRYSFLGSGEFMVDKLIISFLGGLLIFFLGLIFFNRAERNSIDTV